MRSSRGEIKIEDILNAAGVDFQEEYSFSDLTSSNGTPLRFDFAVFTDDGELDFLIEFQGIQHFEPRSKFGGAEGLRKQRIHDLAKQRYCEKNKIKLILIPYYDESKLNYDYIFSAAGYNF